MIKCNDSSFDRVCVAVYNVLGLSGDHLIVELDIVSSDEIHAINKEYRDVDKPTDVLSFGMLDVDVLKTHFDRVEFSYEYLEAQDGILLGNIVICDSIASSQADEYGNTLRQELDFLFAHGLLHLLGYDHMNESDRQIMRQKENQIVEYLKNN